MTNDWYLLQYFDWFPQLNLIKRLYHIKIENDIDIIQPNFDGVEISWHYRGVGKRLIFSFDSCSNIVMGWKQDRVFEYEEIISPTNEQILKKMKWVAEL